MVFKILCNAIIIALISAIKVRQPVSGSGSTCTDTDGHQCTFCLSQTDFAQGTYRITQSGSYCFTESITFNPTPGEINLPNSFGAWHPIDEDLFPGCSSASDGAFALGFFAAISIETSNVIIDLNNHILEMHYTFYLQQRFYSHIEIAPQPFLPDFGPADFGDRLMNIENIIIQNGELGLTSHHGIHSNNATNILIQNLRIYDFEVAGIQLNGFHGAILKHLDIGPSVHSVPVTGYYSNARFLLLALRQLLSAIKKKGLDIPTVSFAYLAKGESLSLQSIYNKLIRAMDVVFLDKLHLLSPTEKELAIYDEAMSLFSNTEELPDGSAIYGILLNSFSVAVNGFGEASMLSESKVLLQDIDIKELKIAVNEIPAIYFDACDDPSGADTSKTALKGPFGDVIDIRKMIDPQYAHIIDNLDLSKDDLSQLKYIGNVLSDAQIALYLYGNDYVGNAIYYAFGSHIHDTFLDWALNDTPLPLCTGFICNGDIMHHTNKGIMGFRVDGITDVTVETMKVRGLENKSPLSSNACSDYTGPFDGGIPGSREGQGGMNTDVRGYSLTNSGVFLVGEHEVSNLETYYGDVTAIDLMEDSILEFDHENVISMRKLRAASKLYKDTAAYNILVAANKSPYPNNFDVCTIRIQDNSIVVGDVPSGLSKTHCVNRFSSA